MKIEARKERMSRVFGALRRRRFRTAAVAVAFLSFAYGLVYFGVSVAESPTDRILKLSDSRELAYKVLREGDPSRQPVVLIHGAPADASSWNRLLNAIPDDFKHPVISVDRLGYGNSTPSPELSLVAHAKAIHELIATLPQKPILVGHSYGGPVVLRLASDYSDEIAGIVLIAGACDPYMEDAQGLRRAIDDLGRLVPAPWANANAELLALTGENRDMEPELKYIQCPVTVVHGTWDPVCPYESTVAYLRRAMPNAPQVAVRSLPKTGHSIHLWQPEVVVEEIETLVR